MIRGASLGSSPMKARRQRRRRKFRGRKRAFRKERGASGGRGEMKHHRENLFVFDREEDIASFLIEHWAEVSREAIEEKGFFAAALSGGQTPIPFYKEMAEPGEEVGWDQTHIFLADERFVPSGHPDSNFRIIAETLLNRVPIPSCQVHPVPVEEVTPEDAAIRYEQEIRDFFGLVPGTFPRFDLILLGIGTDGHTASLFPGAPVLENRESLAAAVHLDEKRHARITLTLRVLNQAANVVFLARGKEKASIVERVLRRDPALPASRVRPVRGELFFVLDSAAHPDI
jgi:6-phosphogluconolactonase